jgi:hypothetical protein
MVEIVLVPAFLKKARSWRSSAYSFWNPRICLAVVLAGVAGMAVVSRAAVITWTNSTSGNWNVAANWSPNQEPGASDTAQLGNSATITVTAPATVGGLNFSSGNLNGSPLTVNGVMNWSGGTLNGALVVAASGTLNITNGPGFNNTFPGTPAAITNYGTVVMSSSLGATYSVNIYNGGLWQVAGDYNFFQSSSGYPHNFINAGTLEKISGANSCTFSGWSLNNNGSINTPTGYFTTGSWFGINTFYGAANIYFNFGSFNLTIANGAALGFMGGNVDGPLTVAPGGTLNILSTLTMNPDSSSVPGVLTNYGTVVMSNTVTVDYNATIYNAGLWEIAGDYGFSQQASGYNRSFINAGTLEKVAGGNSSTFNGWGFNNTGTINTSTGYFTINSWVGTNTFAGSANITLGTLSGVLTLPSGATLNLTSGDVTGSLTISNSAVVNWIGSPQIGGSVTVAPGGTLNILSSLTMNPDSSSTTGTLTNYGTVIMSNTVTVDYSATIYNGGLWQIAGDYSFSQQVSGYNRTFINAGTLEKVAGANSSTFNGWNLSSTGTIDTLTGYLTTGPWSGANILNGTASIYFGSANFDLTVASNSILNFVGGGVDGPLIVAPGGTLNILSALNMNPDSSSLTGVLTNYGTVIMSNTLTVDYNATIYNGGMWQIAGDYSFSQQVGGYNRTFINAGALEKVGGVNSSTFNGWNLSSTGTIDTPTGYLTTGPWSGASILNGTANIYFSSGNFNVTVASNSILNFVGGSVDGPLTVAPGGTLNILSSLTMNPDLSSGTGTLTNYGTVIMSNMVTVDYNATIYNGGLWQIAGDYGFSQQVSGYNRSFINAGTLQKTAGTSGSSFSGWSVTNNGIMRSGSSPKLITINGPFVQSSSGELDIELAGTSPGSTYDQLVINGSATLAGTMTVSLIDPYLPQLGNIFHVLTYSSFSGAFDTIQGLTISTNLVLGATYTAGGLNLTAVQNTNQSVVAPQIVSQPAGESVAPGQTAMFEVTATGTRPLAYQWYFNGSRLPTATGESLTLTGVQTNQYGNYQVVITNSGGSATSTVAVLSPLTPPAITSQPRGLTNNAGSTASFSVTATGSAPLGYQWYFGNSPVAGGNSSVLTLANVQPANQGQYHVVVSNSVGSVTSAVVNLSVLVSCVSAQATASIYPMGNTVPLTVQSFDCTARTPVANLSAVVWISTAGTVRSISATTDSSGSATVNFVPLPTEAGVYQAAASLTSQAMPSAQTGFTIVGMSLSTNSIDAQVIPGTPVTNTIVLSNLTSVDLTGLGAAVAGSAPDVQVQLSVPGTLPGGSTVQVTCVLSASVNSTVQDQFNIRITTAQGTVNLIPVTASVVREVPQLTVTPSSISASMLQGGQTLASFYVINSGGAPSSQIGIVLPQAPWLTLVTPQPLPVLGPGQSNLVTLALTPAPDLTLGAYSGSLELTSSNAQISVPFTFDCVSSQQGALQVTVHDELTYYGEGSPNVSNATITVSDFLTGNQVTNITTDASGMVFFSNLVSAYYTVSITAPEHGSFSTTTLVSPGQTNQLTPFLPLQLVDYTWVVTPTEISDHYEFTLDTTFATMVPWPVVTVSPGAIDLCGLQGQSTQINLTITNSGLISAQGLNLYFGPHPDWAIQPLVTNLGDLLPQTNIVVPLTITPIGTNTGVAPNIAAQVSYHVAAVNATNYTVVPIYIYDADPQSCDPQQPSPPPAPVICASCAGIGPEPGTNVVEGGGGGGGGGGAGGGGGGGGGTSVSIQFPSYNLQTTEGALVEVKLQIQQSAVIARDAFNAALKLDNNAGGTISNLSVTITAYDSSNNVANTFFGIPAPKLSGINAVDGTGILGAGNSGTVSWIIVPATNAAPVAATPYSIGGSFSYVLNGETVTVPLFPVPITVLPTPIFTVDYFLQHDVYADDPFTPQMEPSIPFPLGILVKNIGNGSAYDFSITSGQPEIIENVNDLLIAFQLIGSQSGSNASLSPSFTLDFGNMGPQSTGDGLWYMTSTLEGQFISFAASYQHTDDFGNTNVSLINSVNIHEMNHVVRITAPTDDGLPDFLVNDTTNVDAPPGIVYSSDGSTAAVTSLSISGTTTSGAPSAENSNITVNVTGTVPGGWVYMEIVDPGAGNYPIASVQRSDGTNLLVGPNVWQTPERDHMVPPKPYNLIHLFDYNSTGTYTVTYGLPIVPPAATTLAALNVTPTNAELNAAVDPNGASTQVYFEWGATTNYGNSTASTALSESLNSSQAVAQAIGGLTPNSTTHFRVVAVNSAGTSFGADLTLSTSSLPPPVITQVSDRSIADGQNIVITNSAQAATPPVRFSLDSSAPSGASISSNGVFRWIPTCAQGSSTYPITICATDSGSPALSNSMTFNVSVGECFEAGIGSTVVQVGQTGSVPITLLSSVSVSNLSMTLLDPRTRFGSWSFASSNSSVASASVQVLNASNILLNINSFQGQGLESPSVLGMLSFVPLAGHSGFIPLVGTNVTGIKLDGSIVGNEATEPGQVIVIGPEPLLQAGVGSNSTRFVTIYGNPGVSYAVGYRTNLLDSQWTFGWQTTLTNLQRTFDLDSSSPVIYYRAWELP